MSDKCLVFEVGESPHHQLTANSPTHHATTWMSLPTYFGSKLTLTTAAAGCAAASSCCDLL